MNTKEKVNGSAASATVKSADVKSLQNGVTAVMTIEDKATTKSAPPETFTERVNKIAEMQRKVLQVQSLIEHRDSLLQFKVGADENSQYFKIQDETRKSFETHNSTLCKLVIDKLLTEMNAKIPVLEAEILAATI